MSSTVESNLDQDTQDKTREIFNSIVALQGEKETEGAEEAEAKVEESLATEPEPAEQETPEAPEAPEEEESTEAIKKARKYLRLKTNAPDSTIKGMSAEELLEWEEHVRTNEQDVESKLRDRAGLEKRLAELEAKAATKGEVEDPAPDVDLGQIEAGLREELGEAGAKRTRELMEAVIGPLKSELTKAKQEIEATRTSQVEDVVRRERSKLSKGYPNLKANDAAWDAVQARASVMLQNGDATDIPSALGAASSEIFGEPEEERTGPTSAQKEASKPTSRSGKASGQSTITRDKANRMIFDYVTSKPRPSKDQQRSYREAVYARVKQK